MLLFSTILEIDDSMTPDSFIELVLEWNQTSSYPENVIPELDWKGERNIRFGSDTLWLDIEEYAAENIIAIRFEKQEEDGVIWDTDYVMNFDQMKMAIRLDRSYREDVQFVDPYFSTPYFITLLIKHHYLKEDGCFRILETPIDIGYNQVNLLADVINGKPCCRLPVVYVSKTFSGQNPVGVDELARRLKGVAHVLTEEKPGLDMVIRIRTENRNEYNGAVGIYFPGKGFENRRFLNRDSAGYREVLMEKTIRTVIQYCNEQLISPLFTWQGLTNALLQDSLGQTRIELAKTRDEMDQVTAQTDALIGSVDDDLNKLQKQVKELTERNDRLAEENQRLQSRLRGTEGKPVLVQGDEDELFPDEMLAIVTDILGEYLKTGCRNQSRRKDVVEDLLKKNTCQNPVGERTEKIKKALKGYKTLGSTEKRTLQDLGFVITEEGRHYKGTYYGDGRYTVTLSKTPSDSRSGMNVAMEIIKNMF